MISSTALTSLSSLATALSCGNNRCDCSNNGGDQVLTHCPSHADQHPSLSITERDSKLLWCCHAGCTQEDVTAALKSKGLLGASTQSEHLATSSALKQKVVAQFPYHQDGQLVIVVERLEPGRNGRSKEFRPKHPAPDGQGWHFGLGGEKSNCGCPRISVPLYRQDELLAASPDLTVHIAEGEAKADALLDQGLAATSALGGAKRKWDPGYSDLLANRDLVILPDNDKPGRDHALDIAACSIGKARSVKVLDLPGLPERGDVLNWLQVGTLEELLELASATPEWQPPESPAADQSFAAPVSKWPQQLAPEAFYGLAGDVVKTIAPHTEADPASLLLNFLVYFGNAAGREPHAIAEAARHGCNLNAVIVGDTSKGRKGSSSGRIEDLFTRTAPTWAATVQHGGLSSGEGLIWAVRDPITKSVRQKNGESIKEIADEGIVDKRLLIVESEFASTLKVMSREGNTLSPLIRQAWDRGDLATLTKNNPAKATGAHVSIMGHIVKDELRRYLGDTEAGNGFANRFLWCCSRRAQMLPEGGGLPDFGHLVSRLHTALSQTDKLGMMERNDEAKRLWADVYPDLSEGKEGLFGAITARAEAQVLRLSVLYAATDLSGFIKLPHLLAALAVWDYCEASARYIFGDATGDPVADRVLEGLRNCPEGLTRTSISDLLGRNIPLGRIAQALGILLRTKRAKFETVPQEGGKGRAREVWSAVQ